jgi:hypothetical protein
MALHFHWFLPTNGDGRDMVTWLWRGETVRYDGEGVLPILRQRGRWQHPAPDNADDLGGTTPFAPTSGPAHSAAVS